MTALPIDPLLPAIVAALRASPAVVIEAPPGAGKTTRVPPALEAAGWGEVLALEPRRLAARLAARRVAAERGEQPGESVGYQVRFEQQAGPRTRLRYMTEGVLTRRLLADPGLAGVGAVVLDEFHERHLEGDLALALLLDVQRRRPDLRLAVMSATLDGAGVAAFLGGCPVLRSAGRLHPVAVRYTPHSAAPLEQQVAAAVGTLLSEGLDGDVLVFLPGAAEIRRAARAVEGLAARAGLLALPLHGDLPPGEQDRAVAPAAQRKLILSTNVAESSITIGGVRAVIDSGLARVAKDSPWSGIPQLAVERISQASAAQRAGRAGRTGPGRVIRLYPEEDLLRRRERDTPEILRRELAQLTLDLHAAGLHAAGRLRWLDAPPAPALAAAEELLRRLGVLTAKGAVTPLGRAMARLPLHPRLARLALTGGEAGCRLAAELSGGRDAAPLAAQIRRLVRARGGEDLRRAALQAFPDRVARRRRENELLLAGGGSAVLAPASGGEGAAFLAALEVEDRSDQRQPLVRRALPIEPEWLLDLYPERIRDETRAEWVREGERVESLSLLTYDGLTIAESRSGAAAEGASALLAAKAAEAGLHRFADPERIAELLARTEFAAAHAALPALTADDVHLALTGLCQGLRSFAELEEAARGGLERALLARAGAALERVAPERLRLPSGRQARIRYAHGQTPWVAARLQDFFGLAETPRIAGGRVALVVHLLAPNQRPVQTTADLAGFWRRLYPQVRKELARRYPRHAWPENPLAAQIS